MAEKHSLILDFAAMHPKQVEALGDGSLVASELERQYREVAERGAARRRRRRVCLVAVLAGLAAWLLALTVLREIQLARVRSDLDQLSANLVAVSASVKALNQKLANNRLFNEFQTLEDTIYADEDQERTLISDEKKDKQPYDENLGKLHDLTVLEDDNNLADDEDLYDDDEDDAESGDWYPDYDKRERNGHTTMVRLKPEDFTDAVVFDKEKESVISNIRKIKRLLNEDPENPNIAGLSMSSTTEAPPSPRNKRSVFPDEFASPNVVGKLDDRRKSKKYSNPASTSTTKVPAAVVSRTARNSDYEENGQRRPFIAAHFHGNTSHLNTEVHENYKGNGLVRVSHGAPHDVWYPAAWTMASPHPRPTLTRSGHVHVHHTGVYLVYVQIYYLDTHDIISWVLHRTNPESDIRDTLLQCAQSSHSAERAERPNSCFSAAAIFLKAGDRLAVRNTGGDRHSLMQPEKSFIGLVKLADAEDPEREF